MPKIGVVIAGAASKGAYEIGCLKAIADYFGMENIKAISSSSIGSTVTEAYRRGLLDDLSYEWEHIDTNESGRWFLSYANNDNILGKIHNMLEISPITDSEHYVSIWNFTQSKVEYIPFHSLSLHSLKEYVVAAISFPFFGRRVVINNDHMLDGALLDNIPIYPLVDKDLDYIFCIYFDNYNYVFENPEFDKKVIKLSDFPNGRRLEVLTYRNEDVQDKINYGYEYTTRTIKEIFSNDSEEGIKEAIAKQKQSEDKLFKPRLTADVVLDNINVLTKRYSKRLSKRDKS